MDGRRKRRRAARSRGAPHAHFNDANDAWTSCDPNTPGHTHVQCFQGSGRRIRTGPPIGPLSRHKHKVIIEQDGERFVTETGTSRPCPQPEDDDCAHED